MRIDIHVFAGHENRKVINEGRKRAKEKWEIVMEST